MSVNNSEEEYTTSLNLEEVESPRKRMRFDNSSRKSWSLMDRKTDHEVLQEMGVSLLDSEDNESNSNDSTHHHKSLKRRHNLENVNPNVIKSPRKSPRKPCSPGPSRPSPRSCDKSKPLTETNLDSTLVTECIVDEETPLGQSVGHYIPPTCVKQPRTPLAVEESRLSRPRWEPTGPDAFGALSDEIVLSVFRWLPKRTLAHCMLLCKKWYRVACDESLWTRLDLGNKTLCKDALGRILARQPAIVRLASSEIGEWRAASPVRSRVQFLDLSMATVDGQTLDLLLASCPLLRKLSLESVPVEDSTCRIIGDCSHLEALNLTMSTGITPEGLRDILTGCQNLQSLNISWCALSEESLQVLVTTCPTKLQRLNVAGARSMTDEMVWTLSRRCPSLLELDLSDCARLSGGALAALTGDTGDDGDDDAGDQGQEGGMRRLEHLALSRCYLLPAPRLAQLSRLGALQCVELWGLLPPAALAALSHRAPRLRLNQFMFSAIARPTVGTRRTSIWGLRTRD